MLCLDTFITSAEENIMHTIQGRQKKKKELTVCIRGGEPWVTKTLLYLHVEVTESSLAEESKWERKIVSEN